MKYGYCKYDEVKKFCEKTFEVYGFTREQTEAITDVILAADRSGIESHGIQRMIRYHKELTELGYVKTDTEPEIIFETPVSAAIDGHDGMGQLISVYAMKTAIEKAKKTGVGLVTVKNSNHYGIAGYYARMAAEQGMIGISMTNSESIMVPTFGKEPVLGTNPIAFCMPGINEKFLFDGATTVVPRGKLEVYVKQGKELPEGWALDEKGNDSSDAKKILDNIIKKSGGGILPLGGSGDTTSGYKGFGFGLICEICSAVLSCGTTSNHIARTPGPIHTSHFFGAIDYGIFGDKTEIEKKLSLLLEEIRQSEKAEGRERIFIHGEKEFEAEKKVYEKGIKINEKTYDEMVKIAEYAGTSDLLPEIHQ